MNITLLAKSSSGGAYEVYFTLEKDTLSVQCTCRAGMFHKLCKHKRALITGDKSMLYDSSQEDDFAKIQEWVGQGVYPKLITRLHCAELKLEKAEEVVDEIAGWISDLEDQDGGHKITITLDFNGSDFIFGEREEDNDDYEGISYDYQELLIQLEEAEKDCKKYKKLVNSIKKELEEFMKGKPQHER